MSNDLKWFVSIFLIVSFAVTSLLIGIDPIYILTFSVWFISLIYAAYNLKERSLLFAFLVSFFVFLLGGHFVYEYFGMDVKHYLGDEYYRHSNIALLISVITLFISYHLNFKFLKALDNEDRIRRNKQNKKINIHNRIKIRKVSKLLFYITSIFWIYALMGKVSFVRGNSYYEYYTDFQSGLPFLVKVISSMAPYFFYIYLATLPLKRETRLPILIYLIYGVVALLSGRRIELVTSLLFVFLYFVLRHYLDKEEEWMTRRLIILVIITIPLLLVFLYSYNYMRFDRELASVSIKDMFLGFFQQQGFSSSVIRLGKYHETSLNSNIPYSFFGITKWLRTNSIIKLIFNPQYGFSYTSNNIAFAVRGNSLSHSLSYIVLRRYLKGSGLGSCYIAELYHDFGYFGIVLGNILYGIIISLFDKVWSKKGQSIWILAFCFGIFESFMRLPRFNFDITLVHALSLSMWTSFLIVYIIVKILDYRRIKEN